MTEAPETKSKCRWCKGETGTGTRGGCYSCGRVKHTVSGKKLRPFEQAGEDAA